MALPRTWRNRTCAASYVGRLGAILHGYRSVGRETTLLKVSYEVMSHVNGHDIIPLHVLRLSDKALRAQMQRHPQPPGPSTRTPKTVSTTEPFPSTGCESIRGWLHPESHWGKLRWLRRRRLRRPWLLLGPKAPFRSRGSCYSDAASCLPSLQGPDKHLTRLSVQALAQSEAALQRFCR